MYRCRILSIGWNPYISNMPASFKSNRFLLTICREDNRSYPIPTCIMSACKPPDQKKTPSPAPQAFEKLLGFAEVDAGPFLHYLHYLTCGGLGDCDKQVYAMVILESYTCDRINKMNIYHDKTDVNILGHCNCFQIDGYFRSALQNYNISFLGYDTNNAANRHVRRVCSIQN